MSTEPNVNLLASFDNGEPRHCRTFEDYARWTSDEIAKAMTRRALAIDAEREALVADCDWDEDEDAVYDTNCGHRFVFIDGNFAENGFIFCPYCGGRITHHIHETGTDE